MAIEKKAKKSAKILRSKILVISKLFFSLKCGDFIFFGNFPKVPLTMLLVHFLKK